MKRATTNGFENYLSLQFDSGIERKKATGAAQKTN